MKEKTDATMGAKEDIESLDKAKLELLQLLDNVNDDKDSDELKQTIADYYARKVDEEMDRLWDEGKWSQERIDALLQSDAHAKHQEAYAD